MSNDYTTTCPRCGLNHSILYEDVRHHVYHILGTESAKKRIDLKEHLAYMRAKMKEKVRSRPQKISGYQKATRQIVAFVIGDRSETTCRKLWEALPAVYRQGNCYTDFWSAYQAIIPEEHHQPSGKESGETAHIERLNNTLRQRMARFVRKTLSFSKSDLMHQICLTLFLWRYNMDISARYLQAIDL